MVGSYLSWASIEELQEEGGRKQVRDSLDQNRRECVGGDRSMGRGKIEIKKIENPTNRQVTYSKRRLGLMKKAKELTVLCDAQVSLLMVSSTNKIAEYCSPYVDTKDIFERYQQVTGIDLWSAQYERMQNTLNHLKEINEKLRLEMRQRMGESLEGLDIEELRGLEQSVDDALKLVRHRKYHVISTQTDTYKKKLKNSHEAHRQLLHELGSICTQVMSEEQDQEYVDAVAYGANSGMDVEAPRTYEEAIALANATHLLALGVQPNQPNLHAIGFESPSSAARHNHDLRLA